MNNLLLLISICNCIFLFKIKFATNEIRMHTLNYFIFSNEIIQSLHVVNKSIISTQSLPMAKPELDKNPLKTS